MEFINSNPFDGIPIGDFSANNTETCVATGSTSLVVVPEDDGQQYDDHQKEAVLYLVTGFPDRSFMELIQKNKNSAEIRYDVETIKNVCERSPANGLYHYKAGGRFTAAFTFNDLETVSEDKRNYYLRMELRRTSQKWSHVPVNKTCEDHSSDQNQYPIQKIPTAEGTYVESRDKMRYYLYYATEDPTIDNKLECTINIMFPCFNKCVNSTDASVLTSTKRSCQEEARDIYLSVTLECWTSTRIYELSEEIKIPLWSKASINKRDLEKQEKRKLKGSAAQLQLKRKPDEDNEAFIDQFSKRIFTPVQIERIQVIIQERLQNITDDEPG